MDLLIQNLTGAIECGFEGGSNYSRLFAQGFVFHPDPNDSLELSLDKPEAYLDWDDEVESEVFNQIFATVDSMRLALNEIDRNEGGTDAWLKEDYTLTAYRDGNPTEYIGVATFTLLREGGTWKIIAWVDERSAGASWGRFKGEARL